jgi:hypothetical protein
MVMAGLAGTCVISMQIGEIAGADGLYWREGLYAFDASTRSRVLIPDRFNEAPAMTPGIIATVGEQAIIMESPRSRHCALLLINANPAL